MSPLVVLGSLGTFISTVTIVPHVLHALRNKKPGGSPVAWSMGVTGSSIWFVYGIASGDFLVGAPGLITIPCGLLLAAWSIRSHSKPTVTPLPAAVAVHGVPPRRDVAPEPKPGETYQQPLPQPGTVVHAMTDTGTIRAVRLIEPQNMDAFRDGQTLEMPRIVALA